MIFYWFLSFLVLKMIRSSSENIVTNKIHILDQLPPITEKSAVLRQFSWLFEVRSIVHFGLASFYYFIRSANSNLPNITWSYSSQNSHWRSHTVILVITNQLITRTYLEPKTFTIIILSNRYMWYIEKATLQVATLWAGFNCLNWLSSLQTTRITLAYLYLPSKLYRGLVIMFNSFQANF